MPENEKRTKPKYEAPTVVALGGLARGAGVDCAAGSSANPGYARPGQPHNLMHGRDKRRKFLHGRGCFCSNFLHGRQ